MGGSKHHNVIARLDPATQYSGAPVMESRSRGVLGTPLEPVIGLAEGETRWRSMTVRGVAPPRTTLPHAFFFTSLTLEKMIPSARSLV